MILGAQKSATSTLYKLLIQHPEIIAPVTDKEIGFFNNEIAYHKGIKQYHKHFPKTRERHHTFDATPEYFYMPACAERIYKYNKNLKFILLLREPVERAYSAWNMYRHLIDEDYNYLMTRLENTEKHTNITHLINLLKRTPFPAFEEFIEEEQKIIENTPNIMFPGLIRYGFYDEQLERYFNFFDKKQFLIVGYKEFTNDPKLTVAKIIRFLNIKEVADYYDQLNLTPVNKRDYKEKINASIQASLSEIFIPHNDNLRRLIENDNFNF